jgi:hypothetical protein
MTRPRVPDVENAIDTATQLFRRNGCDRTSVAELVGAMDGADPGPIREELGKLGEACRARLCNQLQQARAGGFLRRPIRRNLPASLQTPAGGCLSAPVGRSFMALSPERSRRGQQPRAVRRFCGKPPIWRIRRPYFQKQAILPPHFFLLYPGGLIGCEGRG